MKKAFTMIELIFVIVIVGIISAMIAPSFQGNNLRRAADQVVSHIRYTQHLAMIDNRFDPSDATWFKERWQIRFAKTAGSENQWSYTIYSDNSIAGPDGVPNKSEMAINPLSQNQRLTGGYSAGTVKYSDPEASKELNLGHEYGIQDIDFDPTSGCSIAVTQQLISFESIGRPLFGNSNSLSTPYLNGGVSRLIQTQCRIQLCLTSPCTTAVGENIIEIAIEPETGYAHIL